MRELNDVIHTTTSSTPRPRAYGHGARAARQLHQRDLCRAREYGTHLRGASEKWCSLAPKRSDSKAWPSGLDSGERWGPGRQVIRRCSMILSVEPEPKKVPYPARVARPPVLGPGPVGPTTNGPPDVIRNVPVVKPLRDVVP